MEIENVLTRPRSSLRGLRAIGAKAIPMRRAVLERRYWVEETEK